MEGINQFIIDGNLARDVELRKTARGTPTCTYVVAVGRVRFDGEQRVEDTDFIPVTTYGRQAEADARFLRKGAAVTVIGRIGSWYQREQKKGGFNFEAERVIYRGKSTGADNSPPEADGYGDEWLRDYENQGRAAAAEAR